jgi:hypothetical protein
MSKLKQEILEVVKKGENVLQSWQGTPGDRDGEGNVYECRFSAPDYNPDTGEGVTCVIGDLRKYTRVDSAGDTQTYIIKKDSADQELVMNADDPNTTNFGLAGVELDIPTVVANAASFSNTEKLLKNDNKYFSRLFVAKSASGGVTTLTGAADTTAQVFLENPADLLKRWDEVRDVLFDNPTAVTDVATPGQIVYHEPTSGKARVFTKNFFGKIKKGDTVPANTIFYYDGLEEIFDDSANGVGNPDVKKTSAKGYYLYVAPQGTDLIIDDEAVIGGTSTLFLDANTSGARPARYVLSGNTGQAQANFDSVAGFQTLGEISFDEFSETASSAGQVTLITNPSASNLYWSKSDGATEPVDGSGAASAGFALTGGDTLTDTDYWNLISESFIEDYGVGVGSNGLESSDDGGEFSTKDSAGVPKTAYTGYTPSAAASNVARVIEITETTGSTGLTEVEIITEFKHGLQPGDSVTIAGTGITQLDGPQEVSTINGIGGSDLHRFALKDISKTATGAPSDIPASSGTAGATVSVSAIATLFWGSHNPPTTDQALVYRH